MNSDKEYLILKFKMSNARPQNKNRTDILDIEYAAFSF